MARSAALGESRQVTLPEGTIEYRETGSGPPVVFVHGLMVNGDLWRNVVPWLSGRYRCITPDLPLGSQRIPMNPGTDFTLPGVARLLAGFLDALDLEDVTVVANDTGGAITQVLITQHPSRVGRVVFTPCDSFEDFLPPAFRHFGLLMPLPGVAWLSAHAMRLRALQRLPLAFGWLMRKPLPAEVLDSFMDPIRHNAVVRRDFRALVRAIDSRYTLDAAARLGGFNRPVLVAWSDHDRVFSLANGRRLAALLPSSRFEVVRDSRAFVPEDQPERLGELVGRFVSESSGAPARSIADDVEVSR
jgi:pimeloyl-ACP methyl ester carboxylesterase